MNKHLKTVPQNGNILVRLQNYMQAFTKAEKKVADVVLTKPEDLIYYSITELAEQAGVGEATIIRFSRKIGCKSYQELKLTLAQELAKPVVTHNEETLEEDKPMIIANKLTAMNTKALNDTMAILDESELEGIIRAFLNAKKIHFYGVGTSGMAALFAKYQFQRIGLLVDGYDDSHFQAIAATTLGEGDIAFGISLSGSTTDTIHSLNIAKEEGATVICLTHHARSPITKIADHVLLTSVEEGPLERGTAASFVSQLHVLDILLTCIGMRMKEKAVHFKEKTAKAVMNKIL